VLIVIIVSEYTLSNYMMILFNLLSN